MNHVCSAPAASTRKRLRASPWPPSRFRSRRCPGSAGARGQSLPQAASRTQTQRQQSQTLMRTLLDVTPSRSCCAPTTAARVRERDGAQHLFDGQESHRAKFLQLVANGQEAFRSALLSTADEMSTGRRGKRETYNVARALRAPARAAHVAGRASGTPAGATRQRVLKKVVRMTHEVNTPWRRVVGR